MLAGTQSGEVTGTPYNQKVSSSRLPVKFRIQLRIPVITLRALYSQATTCVSDLTCCFPGWSAVPHFGLKA